MTMGQEGRVRTEVSMTMGQEGCVRTEVSMTMGQEGRVRPEVSMTMGREELHKLRQLPNSRQPAVLGKDIPHNW